MTSAASRMTTAVVMRRIGPPLLWRFASTGEGLRTRSRSPGALAAATNWCLGKPRVSLPHRCSRVPLPRIPISKPQPRRWTGILPRVSDEPSTSHSEQPPTAGPEQGKQGFGDLRHYVPSDLLNPSFPIAVRGYNRESVEDYVKRANRVIAELKVGSSPRAAVTHALEQTEEQVSGLLQRARDTGEEITASARAEADEIVAQAKAEAAELLVNVSAQADVVKGEADGVMAHAQQQAEEIRAKAAAEAEQRRRGLDEELASARQQAETQMRALQNDTGEVWADRDRLLADVRRMASELLALADAAALRHAQEEPESVDDVERAGADVRADAPTEIREPKRAAPAKK